MTDSALQTEQNPLIVIASNRGPFKFTQHENGTFSSSRGAGGLVTALAAIAEKMDVLWVASALSEDDKAWAEEQEGHVRRVEGINLRMVVPEEEAYNKYYNAISNPLLWFIQHGLWDLARNPVIDRNIWDAWEEGYKAINQQFAKTIADGVRQTLGDDETRPVIIFPQDYHMYLVPQYLREELGTRAQIQLFVHIPWPGPDGWRTLPREMRETMLKSLLDCDRIGFQTSR
ncbi:MAG: trehalose-6-phosphate synthase, partial [Anaerolineae bacterium]|nr:trehalose-6-phosphate synthase [Anaerolineae bacterium]